MAIHEQARWPANAEEPLAAEILPAKYSFSFYLQGIPGCDITRERSYLPELKWLLHLSAKR